VIQAQLYNSTGSLEASPGTFVTFWFPLRKQKNNDNNLLAGTWVFVSYGTCATVL
jgi:hypothetical protein